MMAMSRISAGNASTESVSRPDHDVEPTAEVAGQHADGARR